MAPATNRSIFSFSLDLEDKASAGSPGSNRIAAPAICRSRSAGTESFFLFLGETPPAWIKESGRGERTTDASCFGKDCHEARGKKSFVATPTWRYNAGGGLR